MLSFKLFAGTNIGLRENNEDNFIVCPDLTLNEWIIPADQLQEHPLGKRGCVMVVADGMGGQNAGEVASAIAIETMQELFSPDKMPADVLDKPDSVKSFLKDVINEADLRVKKHSEKIPDTYGMGSTIIIAWLLECKLYVAWLGDSRAYSFIPNKGIARLSKDHSYVQQLVDSGALTEEEAMNHPNSNVITRSLGDTSQKAKAEVSEYDVVEGEIILLCSDGLCGVCPDYQIGSIIEDEQSDLAQCKERLTTAALAAGGSDNITISLLQISSITNSSEIIEEAKRGISKTSRFPLIDVLASLFALCMLGALLYAVVSVCMREENPKAELKINLSLTPDNLKADSYVKYDVYMEGFKEGMDTTYYFLYNEQLLKIDLEKNVISLHNKTSVDTDTTIQIVVVCNADTTIRDSTILHIVPIPLIELDLSGHEEEIKGVEEMTSKIITKDTAIIKSPIDSITKSVGNSHSDATPVLSK